MAKLEEKQSKLKVQLTKLAEAMSTADYATKVPEVIQVQNTDKVKASLLPTLSNQDNYMQMQLLEPISMDKS